MAGWNLKKGELTGLATEDELWSRFNFVFSDSSRKRNTYKYGLIKSILDNLFNIEVCDGGMFLSYKLIFLKFTENYWNLVSKYDLRQMRRDGKSEISKIESIIKNSIAKNSSLQHVSFESINSNDKSSIVSEVTKECRRCVLGALYEDFEGLLYSFDLDTEGIIISSSAYSFMLKYKIQIEKLNYYSWAKFLESVNPPEGTLKLLEKLELSTPKRNDLSIYQSILSEDYRVSNCFYCGKKLVRKAHVDHFIPWSFVKEDKIWNFVLSCPDCNHAKNNKIPSVECLKRIEKRNEIMMGSSNSIVIDDFASYRKGILAQMREYARRSGFRDFKVLREIEA